MENKITIIIVFLSALIAGFLLFVFLDKETTTFLSAPANISGGVAMDSLLIEEEQEEIDIYKQNTLPNPPEIINALYFTAASAGTKRFIDRVTKIASTTEINAVVIDIKDSSGYVFYSTGLADVKKYGAEKIRIDALDNLIKELHSRGFYLIARIVVFQDPILARARPDLAIHSKSILFATSAPATSSDTLWLDNRGLGWLDPASREVWDYNIAIAKEAAQKGFDEINFDYIRFPSDGDLNDMVFTFWDGLVSKNKTIRGFFKYLRDEMGNIVISADIFGYAAVADNDLGIGQNLEDAFGLFDYISLMLYPSHFSDGFLGFSNPAAFPYEIVKHSMDKAINRLAVFESKRLSTSSADAILDDKGVIASQIRPWLQDFDLGAPYSATTVDAEIQAVKDASQKKYNGFMLWNAANIYSLK